MSSYSYRLLSVPPLHEGLVASDQMSCPNLPLASAHDPHTSTTLTPSIPSACRRNRQTQNVSGTQWSIEERSIFAQLALLTARDYVCTRWDRYFPSLDNTVIVTTAPNTIAPVTDTPFTSTSITTVLHPSLLFS